MLSHLAVGGANVLREGLFCVLGVVAGSLWMGPDLGPMVRRVGIVVAIVGLLALAALSVF